ncbi:MAG: TonB-dependent receptor [Nitrospirae bacterium]|nr:MAG: TonB-dependent receptor [Nitrospirota bacterium]
MKRIMMAACMMLLVLSQASAAEKVRIGEVVVTATRADEDIEKVSSNVTVITQEQIRRSTATTVQDLLKGEEGIILRDLYGTGTKTTVDLRGFARGLNTVILVDGRRLNEIDLSGVDWNTIPLENVERIEIVRGSQSVLYGDNALAGAVNIITRKGFSMPELVLDSRIDSYSGHSEYTTFQGANNTVRYFVLAKHRESDGYRQNSYFDATDFSARITIKATDALTVDGSAGYHKDKQGLPGGLTEAELKADRRQSTKPDDHVDFDSRFFDLRGGLALSTWGELELGYSFNNRKFNSDLFFFGSPFNTRRDTDTIGLRAKLTVDTRPANMRNLLVAGIDFYDSTVNNQTLSSFGDTLTVVTKNETGLYLQDELFVTDRITLSLGYRFSETKFDNTVSGGTTATGSQTSRENAFKAGVAYNYAAASKVFLGYSRGYRLPTTDELFSFDGSITTLRPEKSNTYEAGVVHSFGKGLQGRLTVYTMDVKDELFFNPSGGAFGFGDNENLDKTRHYGAEAGFSAVVSDALSVSGTLTAADAKFKSGPYSGKHIQLVPRTSASLGADLKIIKPLVIALKAVWSGERFLDNDVQNSFDKLESHLVVDSRITYTYKNITAFAGVNNLFDKKFSDYGIVGFGGNKNFYPAPERNFSAGLRVVF